MKNIKEFGNINNIKVKFINDIIEIEEYYTNNITLDNIKIENIGYEVIKNLYFIRDEKQSSPNFIFYQNNSKNVYKLSLWGNEFEPGEIKTYLINLKINNPKPKQKYVLYLYVRENENGENLSKPLKIICTVKDINEGLNIDAVNKLAEDLDDEFNIFSMINREEVINKIIELKCDRDKILDWIEENI